MKYKLINYNTKEETLCDKVVIDGFDYYVNDDEVKQGDSCIIDRRYIGKVEYILPTQFKYSSDPKKIIATKRNTPNNPNIGLPQVVDVIKIIARKLYPIENTNYPIAEVVGYQLGYSNSQQSHPYSIDDMIEFANWYKANDIENNAEQFTGYTDRDILDYWDEQRTKTVYYEQLNN